MALSCLLEAAVFYGRYFGWYGWGSLLLPALATLVPALVFALGCGWLLARIRPWLLYPWMPAAAVIAQLVLLACGTIALFIRPKRPGIRAAARRSVETA